jgi:hypothetical protein
MNDILLVSITFYRHARKYFTIFEDEQLQDVQHCMALLAFPTTTGISSLLSIYIRKHHKYTKYFS